MEFFGSDPGRKAILYFLAGILIGTILLSLPVSHAGRPIGFVDALFTATSAVCVTGLVVVDTGRDFSMFGQVVILSLIQLGGLGIMTFATVLITMAGARITFRDRLGLTSSFGSITPTRATSLLGAVLGTTLLIELIGATVLYLQFTRYYPDGQAAWYALFHSISAFCNAGFSPFATSLEGFSGDAPLLLTFSALIILGGLGFVVITEVFHRMTGEARRVSIHTKICLTASGLLLLAGTVLFLAAEYGNTLGDLPFLHKLTNAFFQSVVCRTAGFNAIPQAGLTEAALLLTMLLMFIGGCPGSTAGGIKTTTFTLIVITVWSRFRGHRTPAVFRRSITQDSIVRAVSVFILSAFVITAAIVGLTLAYDFLPGEHGFAQNWLASLLFEVISAFGTVGLSLGATPHLNTLSKIIIVLTMFIGRVGLLTLAFSLARPLRSSEGHYAEEPVTVG